MPDADTENLERLWELLKRYQFYIFCSLALLLTAIFGFTYQHTLFDDNRDEVNAALFALLDAAEAGGRDEAVVAYETLERADNFPELRNLGAFSLMSLHVTAGDYDAAAALMRGVLETTEDDGLRRLAALRLSETLINDGDYDEAVQVLEDNAPLSGHLAVLFKERAADAAFASGDYVAAHDGYNDALEAAATEGLESYISVLLIKLGALLSEETHAAAAGDKEGDNE